MDQPAISPAQWAQLTAILLAHPVLGEVLRRSPARGWATTAWGRG